MRLLSKQSALLVSFFVSKSFSQLLVLLISYLMHSIFVYISKYDYYTSKRNKDSKSSEKDIQDASTG